MKIKRYKRVNRHLTFYRNNFAYTPPYRLLLDGTICQAALENRINLREQLNVYLQDSCILYTTRCILRELELLGSPLYGALQVAKRLDTAKCNCKEGTSAAHCILRLVRKKRQQYFVGTQDAELQSTLDDMAGVPILYVKHSAPLLAKPSVASLSRAERKVKERINCNVEELREMRGMDNESSNRSRKRKRKAGPNPLSCKRKKVKKSASEAKKNDGEIVKRKRRKRKRKTDSEAVQSA